MNVGVGGVGGDVLASGASLIGVPGLEVPVFDGSNEVGVPSVSGMGVGVFPWRACIS